MRCYKCKIIKQKKHLIFRHCNFKQQNLIFFLFKKQVVQNFLNIFVLKTFVPKHTQKIQFTSFIEICIFILYTYYRVYEPENTMNAH